MNATLVRSPDDMDNETFAKHMNTRHADSLGGLQRLALASNPSGLADTWRAFHRRLHMFRVDLDHYHSDGRQEMAS